MRSYCPRCKETVSVYRNRTQVRCNHCGCFCERFDVGLHGKLAASRVTKDRRLEARMRDAMRGFKQIARHAAQVSKALRKLGRLKSA